MKKIILGVIIWAMMGSVSYGFTITEMTVVTGIVSTIPVKGYLAARKKAHHVKCTHNLKQVYKTLLIYEMTNGGLPKASFYPKDGAKSKKSIVKLLNLPTQLFTCSCLPQPLIEKGLTFLWNDKVSGIPFHNIKDRKKTWLLVEMSIVSSDIAGPHENKYNVLWADGSVSLAESLKDIKPKLTHSKKPEKKKEESAKDKEEDKSPETGEKK